MVKKLLLVAASLLLTAQAWAAEDKSEDFRTFFTSRFIGQESTSADTWDMTMCLQKNPITGNCIEHGGYKIKGVARGTVVETIGMSGRGVLLEQDCDPWTGACSPYFRIDQSFQFKYDGRSSGRKQCYPGNFFCGYEWEDLNPQGRIFVDIAANKATGFNIMLRYEVLPGHNDRPNRLVASAMRSLKQKAKELVETYTNQHGVSTTIVITD